MLARWGRWDVFGAQAVISHGVPRLSADVDVTVGLDPDAPERFAREMAAAGFALRVDDPDFVRRIRVMPFVHLPTSMTIGRITPHFPIPLRQTGGGSGQQRGLKEGATTPAP